MLNTLQHKSADTPIISRYNLGVDEAIARPLPSAQARVAGSLGRLVDPIDDNMLRSSLHTSLCQDLETKRLWIAE